MIVTKLYHQSLICAVISQEIHVSTSYSHDSLFALGMPHILWPREISLHITYDGIKLTSSTTFFLPFGNHVAHIRPSLFRPREVPMSITYRGINVHHA